MPKRHPKTVSALENSKALRHAAEDMFERIERIRARRPSPSGRVIPEVDGLGRLTDLYIAPGTIATAASCQSLADDIMAAVRESTADAVRQHKTEIRQTVWPEMPDVPTIWRHR
ncbi:YbaB/EbfC family nucleoid-associated protein [Nocardia carnea]|uniref:YbaB/EbfC family nucleoid-associated protein n=1 Tax=Nocardia carnea TaxID=37328 RepID=UPI002456E189|nr:YbaB/EbfC family nucleoid-associated protein [Nocardia carnea]